MLSKENCAFMRLCRSDMSIEWKADKMHLRGISQESKKYKITNVHADNEHIIKEMNQQFGGFYPSSACSVWVCGKILKDQLRESAR